MNSHKESWAWYIKTLDRQHKTKNKKHHLDFFVVVFTGGPFRPSDGAKDKKHKNSVHFFFYLVVFP
jgi:hypothetical protein